ncbi:hypothetical protein CY34DRAFT_110787, partial [Suillus luteus UH-Slu-Lm8-n1]
MQTPSSPSSIITTPPDCHEKAVRLAKLMGEAMFCSFALLHYDSASKKMIKWYWPDDDEGKKVLPSNFAKYRNERDFRYPCCLCADGCGKEAYIEAAVYPWKDDTDQETYWRARCTSDTCGYKAEHGKPCPIQLEWTRQEQAELFKRLKSSMGDGITAKEFWVLFKCCEHCSRVGIRPVREGCKSDNRGVVIADLEAVVTVWVDHIFQASTGSRVGDTIYWVGGPSGKQVELLGGWDTNEWRERSAQPLSWAHGARIFWHNPAPGHRVYFYNLRTELYILYFLLKGRVYNSDIWQIIGGRILEAQMEELLQSAGDSIGRSIDPSFHLLSTWVPPGVQEALDKACHSELRSQAGLMATYVDMEGYHSHQRNPELELLHLHVKMCCAKAEVEVYKLAIENAPASNSSDSNTSSSPSPTWQPPLEEMSKEMYEG